MSIMPIETPDKAYSFGSVTLMQMLVSDDDYPLASGNSFGVWTTEEIPEDLESGHYNITNMCLENLERLLETGKISWPIDIFVISKDKALIVDKRVPRDYFYKDLK